LIALGVIERRRAGGCAEPHLAQEFGVVGDRGEVQRSTEAHRARLVWVSPRKLHLSAAGEPVCIRRCPRHAKHRGVVRKPAMNVQVTEQRLPQRVVVVARLALLGAFERLPFGHVRSNGGVLAGRRQGQKRSQVSRM
jgi:hypothetical protein